MSSALGSRSMTRPTSRAASRRPGPLTFRLYGPDDHTCSAPPVFESVVDVHGNGLHNSEPFTPAAAGTYRWVVSYSGDANNDPAGPTECGIDSETVVISPAHPALRDRRLARNGDRRCDQR